MKVFFLIFIFAASVNAEGPHHSGLLSSVNLGIRYSSLLVHRGIIYYNDFQIDPVLGLFFFDDRLEFLGDSIGYRDFIVPDQLRLRTRLVSITDKPLFPAREELRTGRLQRSDTYEFNTQLEWFLPGYNENYAAELDLSYSKDISQHFGNYLDLQTKIKIFEKFNIEPNLFTSVGWGDSAHNRYVYGANANSGFNNLYYGLWVAFPQDADRYYPIIKIVHFQTLANAENDNEGWLFSFIATYGVLE